MTILNLCCWKILSAANAVRMKNIVAIAHCFTQYFLYAKPESPPFQKEIPGRNEQTSVATNLVKSCPWTNLGTNIN